MAGSTNFIQPNPSAANQQNDATYASDSLTTGGIGVDEILPSAWLNKIWFQSGTFVAAIAAVIAAYGPGYTITDTSIATLETNLLAFFNAIGTGGFTSGNNSNGYWAKDPTGLIRQWGSVTWTGGGTGPFATLTFPTPFTTTDYSVTGNGNTLCIGGGLGTSGDILIVAFDTFADASCRWRLDSNNGVNFGSSVSFTWIAIGY